jgi:hypothetical protein
MNEHGVKYEDGDPVPEAKLGLATTGQLLAELRARIEVDYYSGGGGLGYTTAHGRPTAIDIDPRA